MKHALRRWVWNSNSVLNMRDLGGYACDGGVTRYSVVLRSDQLVGLTREEMDYLVQHGLTDVIDLRSYGERRQFPNDFQGHESVVLHTMRLDHDEDEFQFSPFDLSNMGEMYLLMAEANGTHYARMIGVISEAEGLSVVHCMAGKDRTGIVCALLLLALGVAKSDVIADYQVSETHLSSNSSIHGFMKDNPDMPKFLISSAPSNMIMLIKHLDEQYGGAINYLQQNGLTDAQLQKLRTRMVEPQTVINKPKSNDNRP